MVKNAQVEAPPAEQLAGQEPLSASEKYMASLWSELIGLDQVKLSDKFLDVGGNSLTLNIILTRIKAEKDVTIEPQLFFDDQKSSLFELSKRLDGLLQEASH
ncbi:MAG TPA: phosphopantetheine-binding protein [Candidatus Angelobacter sp.]|jgi:hypothetical protein|nr:phosphopantetheine-binding protein [Candidatus Angelobacter sp.]